MLTTLPRKGSKELQTKGDPRLGLKRSMEQTEANGKRTRSQSEGHAFAVSPQALVRRSANKKRPTGLLQLQVSLVVYSCFPRHPAARGGSSDNYKKPHSPKLVTELMSLNNATAASAKQESRSRHLCNCSTLFSFSHPILKNASTTKRSRAQRLISREGLSFQRLSVNTNLTELRKSL